MLINCLDRLHFQTESTKTTQRMNLDGLARCIKYLALIFVFVVVNGCEGLWSFEKLDTIPEGSPKTLRVAILKGPFGQSSPQGGLEHDYLYQFSHDYGYQVSFISVSHQQDAISLLKAGTVDIAAARLTTQDAYQYEVLTSPAYEESHLVKVCPRENKNGSELPAKIFTGEAKSALKHLMLTKNHCLHVERREADYYLRFFSTLQIVEETKPLSLGFYISPHRPEVQRLLFAWTQKSSRNREIIRIKDRYYGHLYSLDRRDRVKFFRAIRDDLKPLLPLFKKAAHEYDIPWQLIASVAFQESHWENDAESFTGVRGIMQITSDTAEHLGIEDRTDIQQSIFGGAKYLRYLIDNQPDFLHPRDRLALALASYNVGPGHVSDIQKLAVEYGRSPYSWREIKTLLPYLSDPDYFERMEYGQARGLEPISFVNRVMGYYELLTTKL